MTDISPIDLSPMSDAPIGARYSIGTLRYNRSGLLAMFGWLLWGDLCLNLMEAVIPRLVPLQLEAVGASGPVIGFLTVGMFSAMSWVLTPVFSTWSDRHRSTRGRRIPFLLYPTPLLAIALMAVGFSDSLASGFHFYFPKLAAASAAVVGFLSPHLLSLPPSARLSVGLLASTLLVYKFFDLFPQTAYYFLIRDVVPAAVMGRFVSLFRMTATLGAALFNYCVLQYAPAHNRAIYVGCASLYLVSFMLMSLKVREGEYPPPPPRVKTNVGGGLARWFRESFSIGFYWNYFLSFGLYKWATVPFNVFVILYAQKHLHMQPAQFGRMMGLMLLLQAPVLLIVGPLLDRFHPIRVGIVGYALLIAGGCIGFELIRGPTGFFIATAIVQAGVAVLQGVLGALSPRLLPGSRYGQFCAATTMVVECGLLGLSPLCGSLIDSLGQPFLYAWVAVLAAGGMFTNVLLITRWLRLGGDTDYVAPEIGAHA